MLPPLSVAVQTIVCRPSPLLRERPASEEGEIDTFAVPALTRIDEFNSVFGTRFSDEEFDTIGGLVLHELGRMPRRGEAVEIGGLELKVQRADRRRIDALRVTTPRDFELKAE